MGCNFSKKPEVNPRPPAPPSQPDSVYSPDLTSYEAACRADPDLRSFDSTLHERTSRVINTLAVGVDVRSFSLDSLGEVTEGLLEMNQEVVQVILKCKKDIWRNEELSNLVNDYLENSLQTLDFCNAMDKCLKRVRDSQLIVNIALRQFEEEKRDGSNVFLRTLQELKNFKTAGDPFGDEFFLLFQSIYTKQMIMLEKLQVQKNKLDKKLSSLKTWRKLSNVLFMTTFTAVLICSVVAAAIAAPPVVTALAAAAAVPLGSMGKWINSLWRKHEKEIKGQREFITSMQFGTFIVVQDLVNIRVLVTRLEIKIEELLQNAAFALREEEAVALTIDEIKKKLNGFMETIEDLSRDADKCSREVRMARTMILRKMIKYPTA